MATRLLCKRSRVISYMPNIRCAVAQFRSFSGYDESHSVGDNTIGVDSEKLEIGDQRQWPNSNLGPLNPKDRHFPLPGMVGMPPSFDASSTKIDSVSRRDNHLKEKAIDELFNLDEEHNRLVKMQTYITNVEDLDKGDEMIQQMPSPFDNLECSATLCPEILKKDFSDLFPDRDLSMTDLTVVTLSQKTQNDMMMWSVEMEEERDELVEQFVTGAQEICQELTDAGYWADFIDPTSGRPYLGAYTNASLFETDDRYRRLGFELEDLGCCKVIRHHAWGSHAYVGCLFTNAPVQHRILKRAIRTEDSCE